MRRTGLPRGEPWVDGERLTAAQKEKSCETFLDDEGPCFHGVRSAVCSGAERGGHAAVECADPELVRGPGSNLLAGSRSAGVVPSAVWWVQTPPSWTSP